jgi:hypothetical protein
LVALLLLWARPALALNVLGIYRAACDRVMGVVVRVERRDLQILDLTGHMVTVPRHEIVSLAYYPVPSLPLEHIALGPKFPMFRVKTLQGKRIVDLIEGWPVDYSEEKISFLGRDGKDLVINRDSIWSIELVDTGESQASASSIASAGGADYAHPQASGFCVSGQASEQRPIFPQQFLNDEVVIKRELDRLQEGYDKVEKYSHDQLFYALPEIHRNETSLGLWLSYGSRHGASDRRNNLTPLLTDELSLGPFGYQHVIMTGSAPNRLLIHEEPQTQLFYAFKAAYFHASVFFDPNVVLVGNKYDWRYTDFSDHRANDRWVESFLIELGFDIGMLSLQIVPLSVGDIGMGGKQGYRASIPNLWRAGPRLVHRLFQADITAGTNTGNNDEDRFVYVRANVDVPLSSGTQVGWSGIYRSIDVKDRAIWHTPDSDDDGHTYTSSALVSSFRARTQIGHRMLVDATLSVERTASHFDTDPADAGWFWKCGVAGSFKF